jgi:NAD(P)-dependent dehydrogenase (short-subunit alcohol dehydrogenase family)
MKRYDNKTILVTGGNSGIGLATAVQFASEGARVVITGRDQATLDTAKELIGGATVALRIDQGNVGEVRQLAATLSERGIRLDAVFANAGVARMAPFADSSEALWNDIFNTNVKGPYFLIQALVPLLNKGAAIVLNGSITAHLGLASSSVYAASKAAVISMARTLSAELLPEGVRVNVLSPGPVRTPLYDRLGMSSGQLDELESALREQIPLKRFGTPDEVASAVLFLASPEAAFIVGTELVVDGGMIAL